MKVGLWICKRKDDLNQSGYRLNYCNNKTQNYKDSKNMVVWVVFPLLFLIKQRGVSMSSMYLCFSRLYKFPLPSFPSLPSILLFCHFLGCFALMYMVKASIPAPHFSPRQGKKRSGVQEICERPNLEDAIIISIHIIWPEPSYMVTPCCCQGSCKFSLPRWSCALLKLVLMGIVRHLAVAVIHSKQNRTKIRGKTYYSLFMAYSRLDWLKIWTLRIYRR